jgi:hypothetical protein
MRGNEMQNEKCKVKSEGFKDSRVRGVEDERK